MDSEEPQPGDLTLEDLNTGSTCSVLLNIKPTRYVRTPGEPEIKRELGEAWFVRGARAELVWTVVTTGDRLLCRAKP